MEKVARSRFSFVVLNATFVAVIIVAIGQGIWLSLLTFNLKHVPAVPWFVLAEGIVLILFWRYTGGWGWPSATAEARRTYRRANFVPRDLFLKTLIAGVLSIVGLAGWWIVLYRLIPTHPNPLPDISMYTTMTTAAALIIGSIVSPVFEEIACRGYCQVMLQCITRPVTAVLLSSIIFALLHFTQGVAVSKFIVYFMVGLVFGIMAYITNSIFPGLVVHAIGDATFFLFIWPYDKQRNLITTAGPDTSFWINLVQAIVCSLMAVLAFSYITKDRKKLPKNQFASGSDS